MAQQTQLKHYQQYHMAAPGGTEPKLHTEMWESVSWQTQEAILPSAWHRCAHTQPVSTARHPATGAGWGVQS